MADKINIGDAILRFFADSSELDQAVAKVNTEVPSKLAPAKNAAAAIGDALEDSGRKGTVAADQLTSAQQRVAEATLQHKLAQDVLRDAIQLAREAGSEDANAMRQLALAQQDAALTAKEVAEAQRALAVEQNGAQASTKKASQELQLASNAIGVGMPRAVRSFLSSIPGVAAALEGAFAATAVLFLIDILAQVPGKIIEITEKMAGWTEEEKKAYEHARELNDKYVELASNLAVATRHMTELGLSGPAKTAEEVKNLGGDLVQLTKEMNDAAAARQALDSKLHGTHTEQQRISGGPEDEGFLADVQVSNASGLSDDQLKKMQADLQKADDKFLSLKSRVDELSKVTIPTASANLTKAQLEQAQALAESDIATAQKTADARASIRKAENQIAIAEGKETSKATTTAELDAINAQYTAQVSALQRRQQLLEKDPTKNAVALRQVHNELQAADLEHQAKLVQHAADALTKLHGFTVRYVETEASTIDGIVNLAGEATATNAREFEQAATEFTQIHVDAVTQAFNDLDQVMKDAGLKGSTFYGQQVADATDAFQRISSSGVSTYQDILAAEIKLQKAQIEQRQFLTGFVPPQMLHDLEVLQRQLDKITGSTDGMTAAGKRWADFWKRDGKRSNAEIVSMTDLGKTAFFQLAQAMESAIASAILSQDGFADAVRKGTAQVLAGIAAQSAVYALFETAKGFAALADPFTASLAPGYFHAAAEYAGVAVLAGAAAHFINPSTQQDGASSNQPATGPAAAEQASAAPGPQQAALTVPRFAGGALVTKQTLAIIGDDRSGKGNAAEATIPLEDDRAVGRIAEAIAARMPAAAASGPTIHIDGIISDDNLSKVVRKINRLVTKQNVPLHASSAGRVTRKA